LVVLYGQFMMHGQRNIKFTKAVEMFRTEYRNYLIIVSSRWVCTTLRNNKSLHSTFYYCNL